MYEHVAWLIITRSQDKVFFRCRGVERQSEKKERETQRGVVQEEENSVAALCGIQEGVKPGDDGQFLPAKASAPDHATLPSSSLDDPQYFWVWHDMRATAWKVLLQWAAGAWGALQMPLQGLG